MQEEQREGSVCEKQPVVQAVQGRREQSGKAGLGLECQGKAFGLPWRDHFGTPKSVSDEEGLGSREEAGMGMNF